MSEFQLRDALASAEFSGRVSDVFASLGSDKVKQTNTEASEEEHSKEWSPPKHCTMLIKFYKISLFFFSPIVVFCLMTDILKPDFDRHQFERSAGKHRPGFKRNEELREEERDFKKPKFDSRNDNRRGRGGRNKGRVVPDFEKNPSGYTKYSLKDVPEVNQRSNSAAAFDFLRQLKEKSEGESEPAADLSQKIVFKKRTKKDLTEESLTSQPDSEERSDKNVKSKGSKSNSKKKSTQMTLSHLDDEEEEEFD